ncbi:uncharacterized protein KY384_003509 [Bacidia gigantensis]|uniref:uncharacterized protein n=1 Tax=Bacidia gigantensis TaxID=2732470 RepID=UPI001D03AAF2|nr:uncharacterized protein KY384_003509 [Bacidia gigantensis]KAG8531873.1 hypothetical protein KY384_003509 [Bacidia gigantensis]
MTSSDDEDVKRAIALSLGKPDPTTTQDGNFTYIESDNDEEIGGTGSNHGKDARSQKAGEIAPVQPASAGLHGLDRKQMEEERLARKRKASPTLACSTNKILKISHKSPPETITRPPPTLQYPQGAVKKTWAYGHGRDGKDIKLEEVLQKTDLQLAVLSSFQWDTEWLFGKMDLAKTKVTLVMQAKEQSVREQYGRETQDVKNLRLCFPNMEGQINCMHSKLMLLSYPSHLRIVVPTANLVPYDWGEDGTMENMVFLIDLPRLESDEKAKGEDLSFFGQELVHFLTAKGVDRHIVDSICSFDFSATRDFAFVHTIGGAHIDSDWQRTGWPGLGTAVSKLNLETKEALKIDFVTSSVGSLDMDFLGRLYKACQGDDGLAGYAEKNPRARSSPLGHSASVTNIQNAINLGFRIYFPTHETVKSSYAGFAGTICMQSKYYENPKFPKQLLRDAKSLRDGLLMHHKILFVRPENARSWAYIGSANCSESAWGNKVVKDKATKGPKINCRNWECGVLLPAAMIEGKSGADTGLDSFRGKIPVPIQYPGAEYSGRKPWYSMEQG